MPPRKPTEASTDSRLAAGPSTSVVDVSTGTVSANPDVEAPSTTIQGQDESILSVQDPDASTMEIDPPGGSSSSHIVPPGSDPPGPSTTFIPRQPSPPLPDLRSERFPPEFRPDGDDDSEDDEVIATLPIYLSPALHPHLHLFQFPLHTKSLVAPSYARDRGKGITARVKEKAGKLEVEVPVDAGVDVWRDDRARELGMTHDIGNGDGDVIGGYGFGGRGDDEREAASSRKKGKSKSKEDKRWGDTVRLRSEGIPSATGYYAGVVQDGEDPNQRYRSSKGYSSADDELISQAPSTCIHCQRSCRCVRLSITWTTMTKGTVRVGVGRTERTTRKIIRIPSPSPVQRRRRSRRPCGC